MSFDLPLLHIGALGLAALLLIIAAWFDARSFRIPNTVCAALLLLFPLYAFSAPFEIDWIARIGVALGLTVVGFLLFARGIAGAGDVKLLAAVGLWVGLENVAALLFVTAIAGGALSLALGLIAYRANLKRDLDERVSIWNVPVPYGIAIAIGGLACLMQITFALFSVG